MTNWSAVIVTRGDVDLKPILSSIPTDDVVVWNNAEREDNKVWGRYLAAQEAKHELIYTQDDDCVVNVPLLLREWLPGRVVANMPHNRRAEYPGNISLIGWGCLFERRAMHVFSRYFERFPNDELFKRECDRVFTGLNPIKRTDIPFFHLPNAHGADRMGREKRHGDDLREIRRRVAGLL